MLGIDIHLRDHLIILVFFTQLVEYEHRRWILFHFIFSNSLQLQSEENTNPVAMIFPSFIVCISFSVLSFYCECGIRVINQFSHFDETVCKCDWYTFPIELQRMLLIFMTSTQQPPVIHGFANAACTRESLKNVKIIPFFLICSFFHHHDNGICWSLRFELQIINGVFSYFMTLRKMANWNLFGRFGGWNDRDIDCADWKRPN